MRVRVRVRSALLPAGDVPAAGGAPPVGSALLTPPGRRRSARSGAERRGEGSPGARQVGRGATVPEPRRGWGWVPLRVHVWALSVLRGGVQGKSCGTAACRPGARCCVWSSPSLRSFVLSPHRLGTAAPRERRGEVAAAPPCPSVGPPAGQRSPLLPAAAACLPRAARPDVPPAARSARPPGAALGCAAPPAGAAPAARRHLGAAAAPRRVRERVSPPRGVSGGNREQGAGPQPLLNAAEGPCGEAPTCPVVRGRGSSRLGFAAQPGASHDRGLLRGKRRIPANICAAHI